MNADALMFRQETTRQGRLRVVTCRIDVELIPRYERIGWRVLIDSRDCQNDLRRNEGN